MKEKINEPIYTLTGIVIHGRGIGKHVGTPTANIEIAKNTFLPKTGVYVADIILSDKIYYENGWKKKRNITFLDTVFLEIHRITLYSTKHL